MDNAMMLLEEYKICQQALQDKDKSIWQSFGLIGAGTLGSFAILAREPTPSPLGVVIVGLVCSLAAWIWWIIAKRWWQLQHTDLLRMRHIEKLLAPKHGNPLRVHYSDIRDGAALPALSSVPPEYWKSIPLHRQRWFGVQNAMSFYPPFLSIAWFAFSFGTILGGNNMPAWIIPALAGVVGIGIGLFLGIIISKKILNTQLDQIRELLKEISEKIPKHV